MQKDSIGKTLTIFGFGGHARSVTDVVLSLKKYSLVFIDENAREDEYFLGYPVLKHPPSPVKSCFFASGDSFKRELGFQNARQQCWQLETIISAAATRGAGCFIDQGSFLGHHAHVGPLSKIGHCSIINTSAVVEHDCQVGDFSHISVNATLAGGVHIGRHVFIGAGAVVKDGVHIGDNITVGAGAVVVKNLSTPGVYTGVPAKLVQELSLS